MTTFTKMLICPGKREGRKMLTNPNVLHARVSQAFLDQKADQKSRVLWRLDRRDHEHILYIVGSEKPELEVLHDDAGWPEAPPQIADYDRFLTNLKKGQRWWFEVVANPTESKATERGKRGKIVAHVTVEHQLEWLRRKANMHGFALPESGLGVPRVTERKFLDFGRDDPYKAKRRSRVKISTVRFAGELEVTDVEALRGALRNGIGRAKGYGCGLLTVAPLRTENGNDT